MSEPVDIVAEPVINFSLGKYGFTFYSFSCDCADPEKHHWTKSKQLVTYPECLDKLDSKGKRR